MAGFEDENDEASSIAPAPDFLTRLNRLIRLKKSDNQAREFARLF
jgi:hypothetical protein